MNNCKLITHLEPHEVFVFGSNCKSFHGAGSAGYAQRGESKNTWRTDPIFQEALRELNKRERNQPYDKDKLVGKWSVLGSNGLMQGKEGKSYGLITTEAPAKQGKVDDEFLQREIIKFIVIARLHPELFFKCVNFGLSRQYGGYSWWSPDELNYIWITALKYLDNEMKRNDINLPAVKNISYPTYLDEGVV